MASVVYAVIGPVHGGMTQPRYRPVAGLAGAPARRPHESMQEV